MTNDLTGRELDKAAGEAIGDFPTIVKMLAWLHGRGALLLTSMSGTASAKLVRLPDWLSYTAEHGTDLREALARLVVAVKQREATDGK